MKPEENFEEEFASTMRIEIPPDLLKDKKINPLDQDTIALQPNAPTINIPKNASQPSNDTKYRQLLHNIYDAVVITALDGTVVDANGRAEELLLFEKEDLLQKNMLQLISGAQPNLLEMLYSSLQRERFALIQAHCVRKDQALFPVEIAANILNFEETRICFMIRDITLRKKIEDKYRTAHNAVSNAANGIAISDLTGKLTYVNPAAVIMWGYYGPEDMLAVPLRDLWSDHGSFEEFKTAVLDDRVPWRGELVALNKDGEEFPLQVSAVCNTNSDGDLIGMVLSFTDMTDHKWVEEAREEAERQKAMTASLGAACHHLGQPATVILANLGLMQRLVGDNDALKDVIETTTQSAEELSDILHKLNSIAAFATTNYLENGGGEDLSNLILDI